MKIHIVSYLALTAAILCEVIGSSFLLKTQQFTKLAPTAIMALCYIASFYLLSIALRTVPLGIAYAIWGGMGTVLIALVSVVILRQTLDAAGILGISMIVGGSRRHECLFEIFPLTTGKGEYPPWT
nr:multidrug efflux SMR transporter [uncultured Cohaesibacter sp.]